jgi:hypothetical protein
MWPFRRKKHEKARQTLAAPNAGIDWSSPTDPAGFLPGPSDPGPVEAPPTVTDYGSSGGDWGGGDFSCGGGFGGGGCE